MGPNTFKLRSELLGQTLQFTVTNSKFYADHLGDTIKQVSSLEELRILPTITKEDLVRHGQDMVTSQAFPARMGLSSGTTFGGGAEAPAVAYQSQEEIELFTQLHKNLLKKNDDIPRGLSITIHNATHGDRFLPPSEGEFFVPLEKPFHFAHIKKLLQSEFSFKGLSRRIEYISGDLRKIKLLAFLIKNRCPEVLANKQLKGVFTNGDFLTKQWRRLLEEIYEAPLFDIYGISEIAGATCVKCAGCGGFHMPPIVVPEVVNLYNDRQLVKEGFGELVLTSLYPFTKFQPLIRYRTGDLVKVLPKCEIVEDMGFLPVGRICKAVIDPTLGVLLPSAPVFELIDDLPDVSRLIYAPISTFEKDSHFGEPRYRVRANRCNSCEKIVAYITIELNYDLKLFRSRADSVLEHLRKEFSQLTEAGASAINMGKFEIKIELTPPHSLSDELGLFHGSTGQVMVQH